MSALLDIPEIRQRVSPLSVEEYHVLTERNENGRRTELIRGFVLEKMSKSPLHSVLAKHVYHLIQALVPPGFTVRREDPLTFRDSEPEPDIAVVKGKDSDYILQHPSTAELVIEIAVTSAVTDREYASIYAEAGVKEYWILNARTSELEVYRNPLGSEYREKAILRKNDVATCPVFSGLSMKVEDLFSIRS